MSELSCHVQTPIRTFAHPDTGSRIDLVATLHVAEESYYAQLQEYIDGRYKQGAHVHYEGVRPAISKELDSAPPTLRLKARFADLAMRCAQLTMEGIGLANQHEEMVYPFEWQNHDIDELDAARRMKLATLGCFAVVGRFAAAFPAQKRRNWVVDSLYGMVNGTKQHSLIGYLINAHREVFVDYRDTVALRGIDDQLVEKPDSDIVMVWGVGHLPGLAAGLEERGYIEADTQPSFIAIHRSDHPGE